MKSLNLTIEGMTCEHCVRAVDSRLRRTAGVHVTKVEIGSADITFDPSMITIDEIADAISDEGYTAAVE